MALRIFILIFSIFYTGLLAQDVKITEILDANLFRTEDSLLIRMVNLNVPSITDEDSSRRALAHKIIEYADLHLHKRSARFIISPKKSCQENSVQSGHLFRKYPLSYSNMNEKYLEAGYAVYLACDTLFMDDYRMASEKAIKKKAGVWSPVRVEKKADYLNRLRVSFWYYHLAYDVERYVPLFGVNYRWSDLYSLVDNKPFNINLSAETGTYIFIFIPYANLGGEIRYKNFYLRGHYDILFPVLGSLDDEVDSIGFFGFDAGLLIPFGKRSGLEIEYNFKVLNEDTIPLLSLSFKI
jgi:hypothetical protein